MATLATKSTIRIADTQRPSRSRTIENGDSSNASGSGIYNMRAVSLDRRSARSRRSFDVRSVKEKDGRQDDDAGLRDEGDFKKKQVFKGRFLLWLAYQSTGVIYGEYVFSHVIQN